MRVPAHPVEIVEVGPRDGLQNEARALPVATRARFVERLLDLGLTRLEVASFVKPGAVPQMDGAEELLSLLADLPGRDRASYVGLVLNARGAERAVATGLDELTMVVPVTDTFATRNQGTTTAGLLDQTERVVALARDRGARVSVILAVAFGCPFEGSVDPRRVHAAAARVLDLGVDELALADTVGVGVPSQVADLGEPYAGDDRVPRLRFHFHNTRNTGYANAWTATQLPLGAQQVLALDASLGGFGGCPFAPAATGNIATEDLTWMLRRAGIATTGPAHLDVTAADETARWLADQLDSPVQALLGRAGDPDDPHYPHDPSVQETA